MNPTNSLYGLTSRHTPELSSNMASLNSDGSFFSNIDFKKLRIQSHHSLSQFNKSALKKEVQEDTKSVCSIEEENEQARKLTYPFSIPSQCFFNFRRNFTNLRTISFTQF